MSGHTLAWPCAIDVTAAPPLAHTALELRLRSGADAPIAPNVFPRSRPALVVRRASACNPLLAAPPRDVGFVNSEIHCAGAVENEKKPVEGKEQKNRIPS